MLRSVPSLFAILAAMSVAGPALAADYGDDWNDDQQMSGLRDGYPTEPGDWAGLGDKDDPLKLDFGIRYWYSMGSLAVTSGGSGVASTDTTHLGELHLRIEDHSTNSFAQAIAGYSFATSGSYATSATSGSIVDGHLGYLGADFGWNPWGDNKGTGAGFLVGYQYWSEALNTGRNNYTTLSAGDTVDYNTVTGQTFIPGDSAPNSLDIHMLRLGAQAKANLGDFFDISGEVAAIPYAKVNGSVGADDPTFSTAEYTGPAQFPYDDGTHFGNISSMRSSPTTLDGWGYGASAEAWLGVHPMQNLAFRIGGRATYLQGTADATYTRAFISDPTQSVNPGPYDQDPTVQSTGVIQSSNPFSMFRYGLLAELSYNF